jgi:hypothetical protein
VWNLVKLCKIRGLNKKLFVPMMTKYFLGKDKTVEDANSPQIHTGCSLLFRPPGRLTMMEPSL